MANQTDVAWECATERKRRLNARTLLAVTLLGFQLAAVGYARFDARRYYCWAPHDQQTTYRYQVRVGGHTLSPQEARLRYRDPWGTVNPRAAEHVLRMLRQYESTYGRDDGAEVHLRYRINGGPVQRWEWPEG